MKSKYKETDKYEFIKILVLTQMMERRRMCMKSLKTIAKYIILTYLLYTVSEILVNIIFSNLGETAVLGKYVGARVVTNIIVLCTVIVIKNKKNINFSEKGLGSTRKKIFCIGTTLILAVGFCMFNRLIYVIPAFESSLTTIPNGFTAEMVNWLNHSIVWFALTCIFIPICEELLFRGIILNDLAKQYNATKGIALSAAIFALFHLSTAVFVFPAFVIIGYLYYKKKNILYPIFYHISHNSFSFLLGNFMANSQKADMAKIGIIGIIFIIFGIFLLYKGKHTKSEKNC